MKGIIIKKTPLDLILSGNKTWEIRGSPAAHRGFVGLVESGRQKVVGFARLVDCIKLDNEVFASHSGRHGSPALHSGYKTPYAWVLESPVRLPRALPYQHKQGCVIWVNIDDSVIAEAMVQAYVESKAVPGPPEGVVVVARAPEPRPPTPQPRPGSGGDHLTTLEHLVEHGYAVVPTELDVVRARADFDAEIASFPEFNADASRYVLGGFGALGNPASFHNPTVRKLRERAHEIMRPVLTPLVGTTQARRPMYFEQIVDRMMVRRKGECASAEAWHRDEAKLAGADDLVFGGWWNLDSSPQYFSCIAGSHKVVSGNKGFAIVKLNAALKAQMRRDRTRVEIPPGHILVFYEKILHEIEATKRRADMYRQFLGWRISPTGEPLVANLRELLEAQAVVPLKSGQMPPMYAKLHWTNHRDLLESFSANIRPEGVRTVGSGMCKNERRCVVDMVMGSLKSYKFRKYDAYSEREIALLLPDVI